MHKLYANIVIFFIALQACFAQEPTYFKIEYDQGLPSHEIFDLFQDKSGYIWIGHNNGISRYDGYEFKSYSNPYLSGKALSRMIDDKQGNIWCINFTGQICYIENDSLKILTDYEKLNEPNYALFDIDKKNNMLYASSSKGLFVYDITKKKSRLIKQTHLKNWNSRQIIVSNNGHVIFTTTDCGIWSFDGIHLKQLNTPNDKGQNATNLYPIQTNPLILFDRIHNYFLSLENKTIKHLKHQNIQGFLNTFSVADQHLLMNTSTGSYKITLKSDSIILSKFLSNGFISDIIKDKEGNYWISTLTEGLQIIPNYHIKLYNQNHSKQFSEHLQAIVKGKNHELYIGSSEGYLYNFNIQTKEIVSHDILPNQRAIQKLYFQPDASRLLISSQYIFEFFRESKKIKKISQEPLNAKDFYTSQNCILMGTPIGLNIFGYEHLPEKSWLKQVISYHQPYKISFQIQLNNITETGLSIGTPGHCRSICVDSVHEYIWACYSSGLKIFSKKGCYTPTLFNKPIYAKNIIPCGNLNIVSTIQNGILIYRDTTLVKQINTNHGLLENNIITVKSYKQNIWILTNSGLQKTDTTFQKFENYTAEDGLIGNDFTDMEYLDQHIWITSGKGLISLPDSIQSINQHPPVIFFTKLTVNDQSFDFSKRHVLSPNENNISISFQGLPYKKGQHFFYKYRLIHSNSDDTTWQTCDKQFHQLRFYSLQPEDYIFEVKSVNEDGIESLKSVKIQFTILKPVYMRWWFILGSILAIITISITIAYFRIKYVRRKAIMETEKAVLEKDLTEAKLSAIKAQMNPHFLFNALSSVQTLFLKNDQKKANENLVKFSQLMRTILDMSGKPVVTLCEEIDMLKLYLDIEINRFDQQIQYFFDIDPNIDTDTIDIPPMVIQPFIENIFKHAFPGKQGHKMIQLNIKVEEQKLIVELEDNGWGRDYTENKKQSRSKTTNSFGNSAIQHRIELLNKNRITPITLKISDILVDGVISGTKVIIKFPLEDNNS